MAEAVEVVRSSGSPTAAGCSTAFIRAASTSTSTTTSAHPNWWNTLRAALGARLGGTECFAWRREGVSPPGQPSLLPDRSEERFSHLVGDRLLPVWVEVLHAGSNPRGRRGERVPKACALVDGDVAGALRAREQRDGLDVGRRVEPRRTAAAIDPGPARRDPVQPSVGRPSHVEPSRRARTPLDESARRPERTTSPSRGATPVRPRGTRGGRECQGCRWRRPHRPSSTAGAPTVRAHRPGMLAGGLRPRWAELPMAWST